jgi:rhodanese-related sulfurtransferase
MDHSAGFLKVVDAVRGNVVETDVHGVKQRLDRGEPFQLVDVREDNEWEAGHLPHAIHLGRGILERDVETTFPDPDTDIVLYCGGGYRSVLAADALRRMGYTRVTSMDGGYRGWTEAGYPVEDASED